MYVFALDIGTRKVAGIIGRESGGRVEIIDSAVREHKKRAMIDGQIHSVEDVTRTVMEVKEELEKNNNIRLDKVTTALAGRSLHTEKVDVSAEKKGEITRDDINGLELSGVKKALFLLAQKDKKDFYCVGYSTVYYTVDGESIKDPVQQEAKQEAGARIIATFLPRAVFNSMLKVLKNCSLEIEGITLEPIAALFVTIPDDMRMLNLALVDVGAGTSDIAITGKGMITAYGMIPKAGDEITEEICGKFLVDFNTGEEIKRNIKEEGELEYKDIFSSRASLSYEKFAEAVGEKVKEIAGEVADEILVLNGRQPQAVVMVGGGSGLKLLKKETAARLSLPEARVGTRLPGDIKNIDGLPPLLKGAEGITPVGILEVAIYKKGIGFIEVVLNGEKEYIINLNRDIIVKDVLASRGMEMRKLYGRPGSAITFTLNGEMKILRGGKAEHSKIFVNGMERETDDKVKNGDKIFITESKPGADAAAYIKDVIPEDYFITVEINGKTEVIPPVVTCGGKEAGPDEPLKDRADIIVKKNRTLKDIIAAAGRSFGAVQERDIMITVNGETKILKQRNYRLKLNGADAMPEYRVKNMDKIEFSNKPSFYRIRDIINKMDDSKIKVRVNGKEYEIERPGADIIMNGKRASADEFIVNGADIKTGVSSGKPLLSSVFKVHPIDAGDMKGRMLDIKLNGEKAGYTAPLNDGDEIEIDFV